MNINKLLLKNKSRLEYYKIEEAQLESELIVMHVLNLNKSDLLLNLQKNVTKLELAKNDAIIKKRQKNIPLAYILKFQYFYNAKFYVDNKVLIPRQETEILVEVCLSILENIKSKIKILEIGTGSGIITGTLSQILNTKNLEYIATDISVDSGGPAELGMFAPNAMARVFFSLRVDEDMSRSARLGKCDGF